jgi:anti-sigma regulatory factor (Ser/Thr protein kinase)
MIVGNEHGETVFNREISLVASVENLDALLDWVSTALEEAECSSKISSQIAVVTEELFVNIASYAYCDNPDKKTGEAIVRIGGGGGHLVLQFEDLGSPFNPLEHKDPNVQAGIDERGIGGLGIYLTKKWMDDVVYERVGNKNILTLYKTINTIGV